MSNYWPKPGEPVSYNVDGKAFKRLVRECRACYVQSKSETVFPAPPKTDLYRWVDGVHEEGTIYTVLLCTTEIGKKVLYIR